jgi:hypothetical protein
MKIAILTIRRTTDGEPMKASLAKMIHDYIKLRASHEGVGFSLKVQFFQNALNVGAKSIFGVEYANGRIARDKQEPYPGFLAAYLKGIETDPDQASPSPGVN